MITKKFEIKQITVPQKISVCTDSCSSSVYMGSLHSKPQPSIPECTRKFLALEIRENNVFTIKYSANEINSTNVPG